jgi:hypothetical protein
MVGHAPAPLVVEHHATLPDGLADRCAPTRHVRFGRRGLPHRRALMSEQGDERRFGPNRQPRAAPRPAACCTHARDAAVGHAPSRSGIPLGHSAPALSVMRASAAVPAKRSLGTTTRSAGGDACFSAKEQSWGTAWRTRSLLSRTTSDGRRAARQDWWIQPWLSH